MFIWNFQERYLKFIWHNHFDLASFCWPLRIRRSWKCTDLQMIHLKRCLRVKHRSNKHTGLLKIEIFSFQDLFITHISNKHIKLSNDTYQMLTLSHFVICQPMEVSHPSISNLIPCYFLGMFLEMPCFQLNTILLWCKCADS